MQLFTTGLFDLTWQNYYGLFCFWRSHFESTEAGGMTLKYREENDQFPNSIEFKQKLTILCVPIYILLQCL